jgi:hypothetical protein
MQSSTTLNKKLIEIIEYEIRKHQYFLEGPKSFIDS